MAFFTVILFLLGCVLTYLGFLGVVLCFGLADPKTKAIRPSLVPAAICVVGIVFLVEALHRFFL